jgi:hypothetical protein
MGNFDIGNTLFPPKFSTHRTKTIEARVENDSTKSCKRPTLTATINDITASPTILKAETVKGARSDIRALKDSDGTVVGYTSTGKWANYDELKNAGGKIVGYEHSYNHAPSSFKVNEDGNTTKMSSEERATLTYGKQVKAVWAGLKNGGELQNNLLMPDDKFTMFIPLSVFK